MADLKQTLDANDYFGELMMWNSGPRKNAVGVVVEGKSDEDVFARFLKSDCVFFGIDGWEAVLEIMQQVDAHHIPAIFGILDADFRRVAGIETVIPNVFLTDYHDAEMMMLNSPAWKQVLDHHADTSTPKVGGISKLAHFENKMGKPILDCLFDVAMPLASLRFLNFQHNLGLRFKLAPGVYLDYKDFIDRKSLLVNENSMLDLVERKSQKHGHITRNQGLLTAYQNSRKTTNNPWEFCNGHDVLNIFSLALEEAVSNKKSSSKVNGNKLEEYLTVAYRFEDFQKTQLYQDLLAWEITLAPNFKLFN